MKNLVIILILLIPLIGISQTTTCVKKKSAKSEATATTVRMDHQPKKTTTFENDECRIRRINDNPKVYVKLNEEIPCRKKITNRSTKVASNTSMESIDKKYMVPHIEEDDLKLGFFNTHEIPPQPLKKIVDEFITIRVYENPRAYYELKIPANTEKRLFTIHHRDK